MNPIRGITLKVLAVLVFTAMAAMIKLSSDGIPPGEAVFFRSFFALPVILSWLYFRHELRTGLRIKNYWGHFLRGIFGTTAMGLLFFGLAYLPFPEVTAIGYAAPLLTVVFAALFLGEVVRTFRISCVLLGLVGVLIVVSPGLTLFGEDQLSAASPEVFGAALVFGGAIFSAFAQIFIRRLVHTDTTASIVFWFSITSSVLALFTLPFGWSVPNTTQASALVAAGVLGGLGQILLTSAYRNADASLIAPFDYVSMIFALLIGWYMFDEAPTITTLGGAALVILAGILIIWRERHLGLERNKQRKVMTQNN